MSLAKRASMLVLSSMAMAQAACSGGSSPDSTSSSVAQQYNGEHSCYVDCSGLYCFPDDWGHYFCEGTCTVWGADGFQSTVNAGRSTSQTATSEPAFACRMRDALNAGNCGDEFNFVDVNNRVVARCTEWPPVAPGNASCQGLADNLYCGNDGVNGDATTLYKCQGEKAYVYAHCTSCVINPAGSDSCI